MNDCRLSPSRLFGSPILLACAIGVAGGPLAAQDRSDPQEQPRSAQERLSVAQTGAPGPLVSFTARAPRGRFGPGDRLITVSSGRGKAEYLDRETLLPLDGEPPAAAGAPAVEASARAASVQLRRGSLALRVGDKAVQLMDSGVQQANLAPSGGLASFVKGNDLWIGGIDSTWRVTDDGSEQLLHGILDWVYQEEVYGRGNFKGHWWSPDGAKVAYLTLDQSNVKTFTVIDHVPRADVADERPVRPEITKYPKAGDPNPTARLSIAHPGSQRVVPVDLGRYGAAEILLVRHEWLPDSSGLIVQVQNRIQTWLDVNFIDAETGTLTHLFRENSPSWVNVLGQPRWLEDGSFLWFSERTGYQNLYRYRTDGTLVATLTDVPWNVLGVLRVDEARGLVWLQGSGVHAIDRHVFRKRLDGKGPLEQLTQGRGIHRVTFDDDASAFFDSVSSIEMRPQLRLCSGDGEVRKVWAADRTAGESKYGLRAKRQHTIPARDGYPLDATLLRPDGAADGAFPLLIDTYSGPDAPSVRNSWNHSAWHQFLAQEGVGVLQVNVRSASGRGQVVIGTCYEQFGVQELRDLEDAVDWAVREHGADPGRVAIRGWSYGGFMSAYALTHSDKFALGFAGAGVHDWQLYDTIYTERYMNTPQANPDGYAKSSVLAAAGNLHGHLVILHGTIDDNVHLQNSVRLVDALQRAGQDDFELMLYPRSRHGVRSSEQRGHMRRLTWRAIQRHLLRR